MVAPYDQALVRRVGRAFRRNGGVPLCEVCGAQSGCDLRLAVDGMARSRNAVVTVSECPSYVPVVSFADMTGLEGRFNTFRRGRGWANRVRPGDRVGVFDLGGRGMLGFARVTGVHTGVLGDLLPVHAGSNHLMKARHPADAPGLLAEALRRIYGRTYGAVDQEFSVIELEMMEEEREVAEAAKGVSRGSVGGPAAKGGGRPARPAGQGFLFAG